MKIICWNIRAGGGVRSQAIVDYLLDEQPDLIALSEFRGTDASVSIARVLADNGFNHQRTTVDRSNPSVNSLLVASRYPVRRLHLSRAPACSARWLAVNVYTPAPFCVMAVHVPNRSTGKKYPFLQAVEDVVAHWRGYPAIVMGDTNSGCIGPDEEVRTFNRIEDRWVKAMGSNDWRDAFRLLQPQGREYTWYSPNGRNGFRLDQMYLHPALVSGVKHFAHCWVGGHERREAVSDHAAMVLEIAHPHG